jgi:hypothetical protein
MKIVKVTDDFTDMIPTLTFRSDAEYGSLISVILPTNETIYIKITPDYKDELLVTICKTKPIGG